MGELCFGFAVPAYGPWTDKGEVRALLDAGEELGFESVWWPDHIAVPDYGREFLLEPPFFEPLAACGWGLGRTKKLRFGVDVLVAPYRHPLQVAAIMGTWEQLEPGRFILGVGIGYLRGEFDVLGAGPYARRAEVTEEFLRVLRDPPPGFSMMPNDSVPVWVGGNSGRAQRRAAIFGDGWHPLWMPPAAYAAARDQIRRVRLEAGLGGPFTFSYSCGATQVLDKDPEDWPPPRPRAPVGTEFSYAPAPLVAEGNRPWFVGTPEQVADDFRKLAAAGVEHVTLRFASTDVTQLERFAADVRPALAVNA